MGHQWIIKLALAWETDKLMTCVISHSICIDNVQVGLSTATKKGCLRAGSL